jgi:acyl-CoA synthetase (AMP-forming)/AMP-acid ligase II
VDVTPDGRSSLPALIQFSSGSTGRPKGIVISRRALLANVHAIATWLRMGEGDATASWLPLYHDMGLIGTTITPVLTQTDLMLMTPLQFLRRPAEWLRCFGQRGATLTAAPAFGYAYAARKADLGDLAGCDFSAWRVAILGAEPIRRSVVDQFAAQFEPLGFERRSFCPAYGLAEATLVVAATPIDAEAVTRQEAEGHDGPPDELPGRGELVGSGRALEGFQLKIVDEHGAPVAEGTPGELWVGGDSLASGYEPPDDGAFAGGWFRTGDVGVSINGELFVYGRLSDRFKLRGEAVLAEDAEFAIQQSLELEALPVVVPSLRDGAGLTVVVEGQAAWPEDAIGSARDVIAGLFDGADIDLVFVGRGTVPRTTSGKPRRRECWELHVKAAAP